MIDMLDDSIRRYPFVYILAFLHQAMAFLHLICLHVFNALLKEFPGCSPVVFGFQEGSGCIIGHGTQQTDSIGIRHRGGALHTYISVGETAFSLALETITR